MVNADVLAELIEGSNIKYRKGVQSYILDCPRCHKKDKLYIRRRDGRFVCFYCATIDNYQGKPEFVLQDLLQIPLRELRTKLYGETPTFSHGLGLNLQIKDLWAEIDEPICQENIPTLTYPYDFYPLDHKFAVNGANYLQNRGVPVDVAMQYDIRYHPLQRRVIFPVYDENSLVGWQARAIDSDRIPKILSSTNLPRDKTLMFGGRLRQSEHAIITEGPVDALKCHLCGGNVATMGKVISQYQIQMILDSGVKKVYLAFDPDAGAETSKLAQTLYNLKNVNQELALFLLTPAPGYKDLGEMDMVEVLERFKQAPGVTPHHLFSSF